MQRQFETHHPIELYVEIGSGRVGVTATETTETELTVEGHDADDVEVTFTEGRLSVIGPKQRGLTFGRDHKLYVSVTLPTDSNLAVKTGSADIEAAGRLHDAIVKTGSGDVACDTFTGDARIDTGSGDVQVSELQAALRIKSGSGDVSVGTCVGPLQASTGSGDIEVGTANSETVVKTGSGDLKVHTMNADLSMSTGSGDMVVSTVRRGRVSLKGASSDVLVGIPAGTPVWTDINTVTGSISSDLDSVGAPQEGQDHVELEARTVSGDITLRQL